MRTVVFLLLLANLLFFGYARLDTTSDGEASRLSEQVQPEKIKILTPQQVAALGPSKVAALADVCLEWGPFVEVDRPRALADIEPLGLGKLLSQRRYDINVAFWVYLPPVATRAEADRRAADARAKGAGQVMVVESGPQRNAVALGAFASEENANARLAELTDAGVSNAKMGPRQQTISQTFLVIRDPQSQAVARLRDLVAAYPGTEAKVGNCEKS